MAASWECPALPMLSLPMKDSGRASFLGIKPMISAHYEENPDSFHEEIKQLDQLRESAMKPSRDYNGISILRRYFAQLHLLRARFPTETIGQLPIDFAWKDIFSNAEYIQEGLQIEQASVLYNISALHSVLACRSKRDLEQEIKESITHFQCAAGAFNYLDERLAINHASKDLSPPFVSFYKNLMLGQAQECFVEKSLRGSAKVKNSNISKLAARVAEYYVEAARHLDTEPCSIIAKKFKDWPKLLRVKVQYFQALSHFYQGSTCEETGQHGSMMAWHQLAVKKLTSLGRIPKNLGESGLVREAVKNFTEHVQSKLAVAKRQNDQVYHDRVPEVETLEAFSGTDLVKPVAFHPTDSKNLGSDIFGRLVPMRAYEASSVYSERKAELLRSITSSVGEKDEELEHFLQTLNVEEVEKINERAPDITEAVLEQHKQMQGKSMLAKKLHADLQEVMQLSETVGKDLGDMSKCKEEDDKEEAEFQAKFGERPPSQVCATMWKDLENYRGYHEQGWKSNSELKAMFEQHYQYLVLLSGPLPSLQAALPKMTPMDAPEEDARDSDRWQGLLAKIKEMQQQRIMLVGQLREQISSDDITKNLVGHLGTETDSFMEEQMKRHKELSDVVRQNLAAQDNILSAVVDANAGKARVRQAVQDLTEQQESMFGALVKAGKAFAVLQGKIREGLVFYSRVHDNVSKLRKRVFEVTGTRSRERENLERQQSPPEQSPPVPHPSGPPPPRPPKKAELAGKPLSPTSSNTSSSEQLTATSTNREATPPTQDLMGKPSNLTAIPSLSSTSSMEEQLEELKRQQQLQLQRLAYGGPGTSQDSETSIADAALLPGGSSHQSPPPKPSPLSTFPPLTGMQSLAPQAAPLMVSADTPQPGDVHPPNAPPIVPSDLSQPGGMLPTPPPDASLTSSVVSQIGAHPAASLGSASASPGHSIPPGFGPPGTGHIMPGGEQGEPRPHPSSHVVTPPPADVLSPDMSVGGVGGNLAANQALLDLHMLLQPPAGDSSLATPLQPEASITRGPPTDSVDTVPANANGVGQLEGSMRPSLQPAHLHSQTNEGSVPDLAPTSRQFPPSVNPSLSLHSFSTGEGADRNNSSMEPPAPQDQISPPPRVQPLQFLSLDMQTTGAVVASLDENQSVPSNYNQAEAWMQQVATTDGVDLSLQPPSAPQGFTESASAGLSSVNNNLGGIDNTMTITSISRPIPAPGLSPPISPRETQEPNSDHPHQSGMGLEQDARPSIENTSVLSGQLPDSSMYSGQNGGRVDPNLSQGVAGQTPVGSGFSTSQEFSHGLGTNSALDLSRGRGERGTGAPLNLDQSLNQGQAEYGTSAGAAMGLDPTARGMNSNFSSDGRIGESGGENVTHSQSTLDSSSASSLPEDQGHARPPMDLSTSTMGTVAASTMSPPAMNFSHGLDIDLHSLPPLSDTSFRPIPGIGSSSLRTMSPLALDTGSRMVQQSNMEHIQALLASNRTLQQTVDEKTREVEHQRASVADHKAQLDNYKQQLLVLQQQLGQVSLQQQKQEQEKATASGQQAVLMQLLQQQQGMFSQQQAQIESLSKVGDSHRKEQMDIEVKYKQALAVEQEKNSGLAEKNTQQGHEIQRLQQQVQAITQQQQMVQMHLYQYQTQIQERDKQLIAFRNQHKEIIQNVEQKYQQKVSQLILQMQELQGELKKAKAHRQSLPVPIQPTSIKPLPSQLQQSSRSSQPSFLPQIPSSPISAHHSAPFNVQQGKQPADILTPAASATSQAGSSRGPHTPQTQVPPPPQGFQAQSSVVLGHHQPLTPIAPQQQLPNPLTPQPAQAPAASLTAQTNPQLPGQTFNQNLPPSQSSGTLGSAQVANQGIPQQFRSGSFSQGSTAQPGHMMTQPGHVMSPSGHMPGHQGVPQGTPHSVPHTQGHPQHVSAQGSNPQLQPHQQPASSQAATSTVGHFPPQGFQMGRPGLPTQGANIQSPPQMQGVGQPQPGGVQYPPQQNMSQNPQPHFMGPGGQGQPGFHGGIPQQQLQQQPQQQHQIPQGYQQVPQGQQQNLQR